MPRRKRGPSAAYWPKMKRTKSKLPRKRRGSQQPKVRRRYSV